MHCNLRPPKPRQFFPALIMTLCQVWSCWTYPVSIAVYIIAFFCCRYITLRCDLDIWPLTLNVCSVSPVTWWNSVPNLNAVKQYATELLRFQCLTLWPWTLRYVLRSALGSFSLSLTFDNLFVPESYRFWRWYVMSRCDLDLWPIDAELLQHFECHAFKLCTKFERNRII